MFTFLSLDLFDVLHAFLKWFLVSTVCCGQLCTNE